MPNLIRAGVNKINPQTFKGILWGAGFFFMIATTGFFFLFDVYRRHGKDAALSTMATSIPWFFGGLVVLISLVCGMLFMQWHSKVGKYRNQVIAQLKEEVDGISITDPNAGERIYRVAQVQSQADRAASENREDRVVAYSKYAMRYETSDIDSALDALAANGEEVPHLVLKEEDIEIVALLSKYKRDETNERELLEVNAYALKNPDQLHEIEPALIRGITDLRSVLEFMREAKKNTVTPISDGFL